MIDYVTTQLGSNGTLVLVEPEQRAGLDRRCFKSVYPHSWEWCHLSDWQANGERARFYGWASKDLPATMTAGA